MARSEVFLTGRRIGNICESGRKEVSLSVPILIWTEETRVKCCRVGKVSMLGGQKRYFAVQPIGK